MIGGKQRKFKIQETHELTKCSEIAGERLQNMKLIKICNTEEQEKLFYLRQLDSFYKKSQLVNHYTALNFSILEGFGFFSLIGKIRRSGLTRSQANERAASQFSTRNYWIKKDILDRESGRQSHRPPRPQLIDGGLIR